MNKTRIAHTSKSISQIYLVHQKLVTKEEKSIFFTKNKFPRVTYINKSLQIHVNSPLQYNNIF